MSHVWQVHEDTALVRCLMCDGDRQVCNVCELPGAKCECRIEKLPTPMPCPSCCAYAYTRPDDTLMGYVPNDAAITMRHWAVYAALEEELARERRERIAAALAFAALAVAVLVEVFR